MEQALKERNDIAFFIKMFPLKRLHPDAYRKSKTVVCARLRSNEEARALIDKIVNKNPVPDPGCDTNWIDENIALAQRLGITGTPTMVFPNGRVVSGYRQARVLIQLIENNQK